MKSGRGLRGDIAAGAVIEDYLRRALLEDAERDLFPWRFADPNPFPEFVLFPRLAWLERKVKR